MAGTWTWTATTNGTSSDWSVASNWSPATVPAGSGTKIYITQPGTYTITIDNEPVTLGGAANSTLMINDLNATLDIIPGADGLGITDAGTLDLAAGTILLNGAGAALEFNTGTIAGLISGQGTISADTTNGTWTFSGGTVEASGGLLDVGPVVSGNVLTINSGNFVIATGATLELDEYGLLGSGTAAAEITFNSGTTSGTLAVNGTTIADYFTGSGSSSSPYVFKATESLVIGSGTTAASYIDLANVGTTGISASIVNSNTIQVIDNGKYYDFATNETLTGVHAIANTTNDGVSIWVCYAEGTHILTETGEVAVEDLAEGTMVMTLVRDQAVARPVTWIGRRRIDLAAHPRPELGAPIRIRQGALGDNRPHRDLLVSPDHCLLLDGKLVPAKLLINEMTIVQERSARFVTYYHVELDRHSVLFAEGVPAESYLDTGNRAFFSNAGLALVLHPEFTVNAGLKCWETDACAPLTVSVDQVKPLWSELATRAERLGYQQPEVVTTDEPELRLVVDGKVTRPLMREGNRYVFSLPARAASLRLQSRASVPSSFEAYLDDWRALGVAVRRIVVRNSAGVSEIPPDHPDLTEGWYQPEGDGTTMWRWMNGNAAVPAPETSGPGLLEIDVAIAMRHAVDESVVAQRLAA